MNATDNLPEIDHVKAFFIVLAGAAVGFGLKYLWDRYLAPRINPALASVSGSLVAAPSNIAATTVATSIPVTTDGVPVPSQMLQTTPPGSTATGSY